LPGGFCFRFTNRPNDSIMFELAEKLLCSHLTTSLSLLRLRRNCRHRR
jgi:hypothetical protein